MKLIKFLWYATLSLISLGFILISLSALIVPAIAAWNTGNLFWLLCYLGPVELVSGVAGIFGFIIGSFVLTEILDE